MSAPSPQPSPACGRGGERHVDFALARLREREGPAKREGEGKREGSS